MSGQNLHEVKQLSSAAGLKTTDILLPLRVRLGVRVSVSVAARVIRTWKCSFCHVFCFSEGGGWSQSPRGGRASAAGEGETFPERRAGAAGEEEGEEFKKITRVQQHFLPPLSKLQPLTHWSLSDMRSVLRRSWRGLGKAMQEIRFVWFLLNRLESQLPLAFLEITNCFSFLLQNRRKTSKLLHKSTARTQSSVRVSATSYAIIYTVWKTSNHLICLLIIILQQRETCRVLTQQSSAHHKVRPLLLWTASSPPLTRTASQPTERRLTLRRSSSWTTAETRRRLRARWSASLSWRSRLESPSWWRRALWSLSMSQVR